MVVRKDGSREMKTKGGGEKSKERRKGKNGQVGGKERKKLEKMESKLKGRK